jgi:hypothetical protein
MEMKKDIRSIPVRRPLNYSSEKEPFFHEEIPVSPVIVYRYRKIFVTPSGICFTNPLKLPPGAFMEEDTRVRRHQKKIALFYFLFTKRMKMSKEKTYLVIHNQWVRGYYHWLIDFLARLWSVKKDWNKLVLLLPEKAKNYPFIGESLQYFNNLNIEYIGTRKLAIVENLVLPGHLPNWGIFMPEYLKSVRNHIISQIPPDRQQKPKRIYITRKNATRRKIVNEDKVFAILAEHGFIEVATEHMSFTDQVRLMQSAEIVVSIHGAGLANILFMNENTHVVEIIRKPQKKEKYKTEYLRLATVLNIYYYCLLSDPIKVDATFDTADLIVDMKELKQVLDIILRDVSHINERHTINYNQP